MGCSIPAPETPSKKPGISSLSGRQIVTAARPFLPHFPHTFPAFPAVPFGLAGVGTVGLTAFRQKCPPADRTGPKLRGAAFRSQRRKKLRVEGQYGLPEIAAVRPCPAFVQHIADAVQRQAQARFPVIVGAHPRDKGTDFFLLVTGQLPGVHSGLRATMARRAWLHDQRPEFLPALFFSAFALLVVAASGTRVVAAPARPRHFLHHSFKGAAGKIHWRASCSSVSSSHGGVSSSSGSSAISSGPSSSYSQ